MKQHISTPLYWGILHGVNDWVAGYLLAHYAFAATPQQSFPALIIYSILAFGGQLPVGLWLDGKRDLKSFGIASIYLLLLSMLVSFIDPFTAIIIAGIASAGIHVAGGCVCLMVNQEKITPLGIFTAPGVAGLTLGGFCGAISGNWMLVPIIITVVLFVLIIRNGFPVYLLKSKESNKSVDIHDMLMILLLLVMSLRSFLFDLLNNFSQQFEYGLLIIGLSAFAGKIIGGLFADKMGWKRWVYITLPLAFIFLELGRSNIIAMAFGVACLQSSVPITLQLMYNSIPGYPATASAMSLGTIVALAGLPLYASPYLHNIFSNSSPVFIVLIVVAVLIISAGFFVYVKQQSKIFLSPSEEQE
ncbi:MAG: hypothetical protein ABI921_11190 [Panacibacter sp.]